MNLTKINTIMKKQDIINQIINLLLSINDGGYYPFYKAFTFHFDYCKYDLIGFCFNNNDELMVECIGYQSYTLYYLNTKEMAYNTLYKFKKYLDVATM